MCATIGHRQLHTPPKVINRDTKERRVVNVKCKPSIEELESRITPSKLFILGGQSNMSYMDPNKPGSFRDTVQAAFPGEEIIIVKVAAVGQPISRWDGTKPNDLFNKTIKAVNAAITGKTIDSVSFVFMQGERDANAKLGTVYEAKLRSLIDRMESSLGRPDMTTVIGRISDFKSKLHWPQVRQAQVNVAEADPFVDWVDTDDLNVDVHYGKNYVEFGRRLAAATIALMDSVAA